MTLEEQVKEVKRAIFGNTEHNDNGVIALYVEEVRAFLLDAGVSEEKLNSREVLGALVIGTSDLWNYQAGGVKYSDYFIKRVNQLTRGA